MSSSPPEDEFLEYYSPSGSVYQLGPMVFVQFRTRDWDDFGYREFSNYARVALFPEHLRPADPQSPGVMNFVRAFEREAAIGQQHVSTCRAQTNGQGVNGAAVAVPKRNIDNGQKGPALEPRLEIKQGNAKPPPNPAKTPARQRSAKVNGADVNSLKPTRSIAGLTLADFLYDR
jgi:hypothetical protein